MKQIAKLIKQTLRPLSKLYKIYILKDEFTIEVKKWFADRGDQTLRLEYPELNSDSIVFDVGGYSGDFSEAIIERYNCKIYIFEPHPEYFSNCIERFSSYENVTVLNYGLADKDGEFLLSNQQYMFAAKILVFVVQCLTMELLDLLYLFHLFQPRY